MTSEPDGEAAASYAKGVEANPEHMTDGYGESGSEHEGITKVRHLFVVACTAIVALLVGASTVGVLDWWITRPNPTVETLNTQQHEVLLQAADKNTRGFNNKAIGSLKAIGYEPVAQSVDHNMDEYYIVFVKCSGDYVACAQQVFTSPDPVVYLGIPDELAPQPVSVRFIAAQVRVDFPLNDDRVERCSVYRGKALVGEAGPVTYDLPKTLDTLQGFAGERKFTDESPDNDASFWACEPKELG